MSGLCVKLSELKATHQKTSSEIESIVQQSHELESFFPAFENQQFYQMKKIPGGMERIGRAVLCALCDGTGDGQCSGPCLCSDDDLVDGQCFALCKL